MYYRENYSRFPNQAQPYPPYDPFYTMPSPWASPSYQHSQTVEHITPYDYFQKPEPPVIGQMNQNAANGYPYSNIPAKPNLMTHFQKEDGQLDLDKVLSTVGQLANTYHQVYPIIQQFSGFLKNFKT